MDAQKELIAEFDREMAKDAKDARRDPGGCRLELQASSQVDEPGTVGGPPYRFCRRLGKSHADHGQAGVCGGPQVGAVCAGEQSGTAGKVRQETGRNAPRAGGDDRRCVGQKLEVCVRRAGVDRRHQVQRVSRNGFEPHDSSSRTVDCVSAADRREGSRNLRAERGRDVREAGNREQGTGNRNRRLAAGRGFCSRSAVN